MVKVARLYHERGSKQAQIASELHITQARVSRLLRKAADTGIVKTVVSSPVGVHTDLEERSNSATDLPRRWWWMPSAPTNTISSRTSAPPPLVPRIDPAGQRDRRDLVVERHPALRGDVLGAGHQSGCHRRSPTCRRNGGSELQIDANRLLTTFASATGATPIFLPAPGLLGSAAAQRSLMSDPAVQQVSARWSELTTALVGIGALEPSPLLAQSGHGIAEADHEALRSLGAVGDVCLRFFDESGILIESELDQKVIGIRPEQLMSVPRRIAVAGGIRKLAALRGALLGGWVNVLITDSVAAHELIGEWNGYEQPVLAEA